MRRALIPLFAMVVLAACARIDPPELAPGLWEQTVVMRVAPDDPFIRANPSVTRFCVRAGVHYPLPFVEDNGSECRSTALKHTGNVWSAHSLCKRTGLADLVISSKLTSDLEQAFTIVSRIGDTPDAVVLEVSGRRLGSCPDDFQPEPQTDTVFR